MQAKPDAPNCMRCAHHLITHDVRFPYACSAMGFKGKRLPQQEILAITGAPCLAYQPRSGPRRAQIRNAGHGG